jgi:hypothetical protein
MTKVTRQFLALTLLGALSSLVSGCISGYVEGTEDYLKFCIERQPSPSPSRCPKQAPSEGMELLIVPSEIVGVSSYDYFGDVREQSLILDS